VEDVETDEYFAPFRPIARAAGYRAAQSTPIMSREGVLLGTLATQFRSVHRPAEQDLRLLDFYVRQAADIIERHKAEDALRQSEERLRLAQLKTGVGIWDRSLRTGKVTWTPELEALFGLEPGSVKGYADFRYRVHPDDIEAFEAQRDAAVQDHTTFNVDLRIIRADGQIRWMSVTGGAVYEEATGESVRILGNFADITERKRAEEALAEREAQLAVFVEHAPAAIVMFDRKMRYLAASRRFVVDYLPPGTQLIGRSHHEAFPNIPQAWRDIHSRVLAGEELSQDQDQYTRYDGRTDWVRWSMVPWRRANNIIGGALLFAEIITEQVEARYALAESEARFRATFENAAVGVVLVGPDGVFLRVNDSFARMLGYSTQELETKSFQDLTHPDDLEASLSLLTKRLAGQADIYCIGKRYIRKDGGIVWANLNVGCVRKADGAVDYFISVIEDITERKRAEQHQRALNAELDHRVKNVLATVGAIIAQTQEASRSRADFVTGLNSRINSLARTHELLSESNWRGASLAEIVRREFAPYSRGNTEVVGPSVTLKAGATQAVATVLHELTTNAAKYGALSTGTGRVSVRWRWLQNGAHDRLLIEWQEIGGPRVLAPSRPGYGTSIIRELIPFELGGEVELSFAPDGTKCRLEISGEWARKDKREAEESRVSE
jgi:PAS domain S-box-containing protein